MILENRDKICMFYVAQWLTGSELLTSLSWLIVLDIYMNHHCAEPVLYTVEGSNFHSSQKIPHTIHPSLTLTGAYPQGYTSLS